MSQAYVSLARQNAVKSVRKLESEYQNILLGNLESALEGIKEVALELESSLYTLDPNEEVIEDKISNYKEMVELDENVKALVNEIANCKKSVVYLGQLAVNMSVGSVPLDGAKAWYQQHMNTSTTLTEEELAKDHNYRGFRDAVLKIRKPEESWGEDGEEDDIRMRAIMTDPYTISTCKHSFSSAIMSYIDRECPMTGCNNYQITRSTIQQDPILARKIQQILQQQQMEI